MALRLAGELRATARAIVVDAACLDCPYSLESLFYPFVNSNRDIRPILWSQPI